jgi:enterochelin esterase-like enzyme
MPYTSLIASTVRARTGTLTRTVWTLAPLSPNPAAVVVFLDAEFYVERTMAPAVVRSVRDNRLIPDVAALFVSHDGQPSRQQDFACSPDYARFIAEDLVAWIQQQYPGVTDIVIAGLSLSGLAATYIASRYPNVFRSVICQSGSFWWDRGRFSDELIAAARPGQEYWLCVGSLETDVNVSHGPGRLFQEWSQIAGCTSASAALRAKGYSVSYREYDGGHDFDCWREDLALALPRVWRRA